MSWIFPEWGADSPTQPGIALLARCRCALPRNQHFPAPIVGMGQDQEHRSHPVEVRAPPEDPLRRPTGFPLAQKLGEQNGYVQFAGHGS